MSTWVGVTPWFGAGSLDGFAFGALMSGACLLAIAVPRRARKRQAAAARRAALAAGGPDWLCEHVMAAEAFGADAERLVRPEGFDDGLAAPSALGGKGVGGYRSRHRLGDPLPGVSGPDLVSQNGDVGAVVPQGVLPAGDSRPVALADNVLPVDGSRSVALPEGVLLEGVLLEDVLPEDVLPEGVFPEGVFPEGVFPEGVFPEGVFPEGVFPEGVFPEGVFPEGVLPDSALPAGKSRHAAFPESAFRGAHRDTALPDLAFPDGTFGTSRRPEARRLPRHAAPGVSFSRRLSGLMTSLAAARALLGAHG